MKKTTYLAPAIEIEKIQIQSLLNSVSGVKGDAGITKADDSEVVPAAGDSRRKDIWEDEEEEEDQYKY